MICIPLHSHAQDDLDFQELMKEVDSSGIFFSPDNYTWCSSVIKEKMASIICFIPVGRTVKEYWMMIP
jgi:hypothetical protein